MATGRRLQSQPNSSVCICEKWMYRCFCKYHYPFLIANLESDLILKIAFRFYRADVNVNCNLKRAYRISQKSGKYVDCSELNISSLKFVRAKNIQFSAAEIGRPDSCLTTLSNPISRSFVYSYKRRLHTGLVSSLQRRISVCIPLKAPICEM